MRNTLIIYVIIFLFVIRSKGQSNIPNELLLRNQVCFENQIQSNLTKNQEGLLFSFFPDSIVFRDDAGVFYKEEFTYSNEKIIYTSLALNNESGAWVNLRKKEYFLDKTMPRIKLSPLWIAGNGSDANFEYEISRCIGDSVAITYKWDSFIENWEPTYKSYHNVNQVGIDSLIETYKWVDSIADWLPNNKLHVMVKTGMIDTALLYTVNLNLMDTFNTVIFTYHYNNEENVIMRETINTTYYQLDTFIYENGFLTNVLAKANRCNDFIFRDEYINDIVGRPIIWNIYTRECGEKEWNYFYSADHYYTTTGIKAKTNDTILIFPNPTSGKLIICDYVGNMYIYNLSGDLVYHNFINKNQQINISNLKCGLYFVRTEDGSLIKIIKIED